MVTFGIEYFQLKEEFYRKKIPFHAYSPRLLTFIMPVFKSKSACRVTDDYVVEEALHTKNALS